MKELKRMWIHLVLLVLAAGVAYVQAQPKDVNDKPLQPGEVELWQAKAGDVSRIVFEDDKKKVELERKSDAAGSWYLGKITPIESKMEESHSEANPHKPTPVEPSTFAAVTVANDLAKNLAALRAKRSFGQIADDRLKEFGFDKAEGTLRVTIAGAEKALSIGGSTAGSSTRYARDLESKVVYVIDGTIVSDLKAGATRLSERNQHEWKWSEPDSISIAGGGKSKRVVRSGTEGRRFWADANTSDRNDETSGNWLSKVERLRPNAFIDKLPEGATRIVRVEYRAGSNDKGFVELYLRDDKQNPFLLVTEQLRLPATVTKQTGEQVLSDLASVLPDAELPKYTKEEPGTPAPGAPTPTDMPSPVASAAASAAGSAAAAGSAKPAGGAAPGATGPAPRVPGPMPKPLAPAPDGY